MEKREELEKELAGLIECRKKEADGVIGAKHAIVYRGIVTLFSTAVIAGSSYALVNLPKVYNIAMSQDEVGAKIAKTTVAVLGTLFSSELIGLFVIVIIWETSFLKGYFKDIKIGNRRVHSYSNQIDNLNEMLNEDVSDKQKVLKKTLGSLPNRVGE